MSPELGQILGKAEPGTKFRLRSRPETTYEVQKTETVVEEAGGILNRLLGRKKEIIAGNHLEKEGFFGGVWMGARGNFQEGEIEIIK